MWQRGISLQHLGITKTGKCDWEVPIYSRLSVTETCAYSSFEHCVRPCSACSVTLVLTPTPPVSYFHPASVHFTSKGKTNKQCHSSIIC